MKVYAIESERWPDVILYGADPDAMMKELEIPELMWTEYLLALNQYNQVQKRLLKIYRETEW